MTDTTPFTFTGIVTKLIIVVIGWLFLAGIVGWSSQIRILFLKICMQNK